LLFIGTAPLARKSVECRKETPHVVSYKLRTGEGRA
jgi:hypothetical protein